MHVNYFVLFCVIFAARKKTNLRIVDEFKNKRLFINLKDGIMYPASVIAYAFVKMGIDEGKFVTQMKLQKLVYFAHGLHLAIYDTPLINEEFEAWPYGPVVPTIYRSYKFYGSAPITDTNWLTTFDGEEPDLKNLKDSAFTSIEKTWKMLKGLSALALSNWSHSKGSPWEKNYVSGGSDISIPNDEIKEYFERNFTDKAKS